MSDLLGLLQSIHLADLLDIGLVAVVFYFLFRMLRESRSRVALEGLLTVLVLSFFIYIVARLARLPALQLIFERFWIIMVLAVAIVFQNEFKRALTELGQLRIVRALFVHSARHIDELVGALHQMSTKRTGALLAIERRNPLRVYAETGTAIDSIVTQELIVSIFTPHTPLHDGAVLIQEDRLVAAACILPLTGDPSLPSYLGTRHRAAIGLSEESDAVVLVVSEETGTISMALAGKLERNLSSDDLKKRLYDLLDIDSKTKDEDAD